MASPDNNINNIENVIIQEPGLITIEVPKVEEKALGCRGKCCCFYGANEDTNAKCCGVVRICDKERQTEAECCKTNIRDVRLCLYSEKNEEGCDVFFNNGSEYNSKGEKDECSTICCCPCSFACCIIFSTLDCAGFTFCSVPGAVCNMMLNWCCGSKGLNYLC